MSGDAKRRNGSELSKLQLAFRDHPKPGLKPVDVAIWWTMASHVDATTGKLEVWVGKPKLAVEARCGERTVFDSWDRLKAAGWIEQAPKGYRPVRMHKHSRVIVWLLRHPDELTTSADAGSHELLRLRVTKAIKAATRKVSAAHPALGHHLRTSIRTGTICTYAPDPTKRIRWSVTASSVKREA